MDFNLTEEQILLKESVVKFIKDRYDFEARQRYAANAEGFSADNWQTFAELGWLTIPFAESVGGFGGSVVDIAILMEEFGRALVVEPYLSTVLLAGQLIARSGNSALCERYLSPLMTGELQAAFAWMERQGQFDLDAVTTSALRDGDGYVISGEKAVALNGASAQVLVVSARSDAGIALFAVDADRPGLSRTPLRLMDASIAANIRFDNVRVPEEALLAGAGDALPLMQSVVDEACIALGAQAVGAMEFLYRATAEYARTRKQFGVPIGSFQALQHRMVDMFTATELCRAMLLRTLCSVLDDSDSVREDIAALKTMVGRYGRQVAEEAVQIHGAMGVTHEMSIGNYLKQAMMIDASFGNAVMHEGRFCELRYGQ